MDGMMVNKAGHRFILYLQLALLHTRGHTSNMNHWLVSERPVW